MPRETVYIVQSYTGQGRRLVPDQPQRLATAERALETARRFAPLKAGVIALAIEGDPDFGDYDEPIVIFTEGRTPENPHAT
jgi:hypothetical protein